MFAIDDSTSSDCAREIRGTASMAIAVIRRAARCSTSSGLSAGDNNATRVAPSSRKAISAVLGGLTLSTISLPHASASAPTDAPASAYASSVNDAPAPAPDSTSTP